MDPLIPTTSTLSPAIAHIAETAASLAESLQERRSGPNDNAEIQGRDNDAQVAKQRQRDTVRWVLAAPRRLRSLVEAGRREEATEDWQEVQRLLEKWQGVEGVEEVKERCSEVMGTDTASEA